MIASIPLPSDTGGGVRSPRSTQSFSKKICNSAPRGRGWQLTKNMVIYPSSISQNVRSNHMLRHIISTASFPNGQNDGVRLLENSSAVFRASLNAREMQH